MLGIWHVHRTVPFLALFSARKIRLLRISALKRLKKNTLWKESLEFFLLWLFHMHIILEQKNSKTASVNFVVIYGKKKKNIFQIVWYTGPHEKHSIQRLLLVLTKSSEDNFN